MDRRSKDRQTTQKVVARQWREKRREHYNNYHRNKYQNDPVHRLKQKIRCRINSAIKRKNSKIFSSSINILGININDYTKWLSYDGSDGNEIDHVKPLAAFNLQNKDELYEAFNWKNTRLISKHENRSKHTTYNELDYQLQFIKAYQFLHNIKSQYS